ncbi:saccharopine dehydrogenase family protein [Rhodococcus sp. NPDC057297]|uniref:saccharopine dehydrogenase family protein n=1 Tax=Rhodococcus sp. NPDC057297 TaxID=3346090 RepID=UPI00363F7D8E
METRMGNILILGATGYTGRLVTQALVSRGHRPVLLGRRTAALEQVGARHGGLDHRRVDSSDLSSLRATLTAGDILISTVGPFERLGFGVAETAAEVGAHYIDSSGEVGFVRDLHARLHEKSRSSGSVLLPAFGYDFVPGVLAGALAATGHDTQDLTLRIGYFATGPVGRRGLSSGTRATMADGLLIPVAVRRDGRTSIVRAASTTHAFAIRGRRQRGFLASGTEVLFLPHDFRTLSTIEVYNGWFPPLSRAIQITSTVANLLGRLSHGRRAIEWIGTRSAGAPGGPDAAERAKTRTHVVAELSDEADRVLSEIHLEGPSIYTLTAELIATAADDFSHRTHTPGVRGPLQVFGLEGLGRLCSSIGLTEVER